MNKQLREYRKQQLVYNRKYLEDYLKASTDNPKYLNNKESIILPFLEHFEKEKISADRIQYDQILTYVRKLRRKKKETLRIALVDFFSHTSKTKKIAFDPRKLDTSLKELQQELHDDKRDAKALLPEAIIEIRNTLRHKNKYQLLFTFEMFYTHGVTLDEIEQFGADCYSKAKGIFTFIPTEKTKKGRIKLSESIVQLIKEQPDLLKQKERAAYLAHIKGINDNVDLGIRDKIVSKDIEKTRNKFFPTCPKCEKKFPNSAEFWALVEFEEDTYKKHWIYCKDCAVEIQKGA